MENTAAGAWIYSDISIECAVSEHELLKYPESLHIELSAGSVVTVEPILRVSAQNGWMVNGALKL